MSIAPCSLFQAHYDPHLGVEDEVAPLLNPLEFIAPKSRNSHWPVGNGTLRLSLRFISLCGSLLISAKIEAMAALAHMLLRTMLASIAATWNRPNSAFLFVEDARPMRR